MKKRLLTILLSLVAATCLTFALSACGEKKTECEKNGHSFATEWLNDATDHWHKCANCNEVSDKAAHVYDNDVDATCNTCGYERAAHTAHTAGTVWETTKPTIGTFARQAAVKKSLIPPRIPGTRVK